MIVDYHMHLRGPAVGGQEPLVHRIDAIEPFVARARERGVDEIAFTEHVYYFVQTRVIWELPYHLERCEHDLEAYVAVVLEAKDRGLPVKLGLEVDLVPGRQAQLSELLAPYPWDILLGSVHEVADVAVDQRPGIWEQLPVEEIWRRYVASVVALAETGAVDVMSHVDLVKIYGARPPVELETELADGLAAGLASAGVAAEVSTAGLRKPVGEIYPSERLLAALHRHSVPITLASDAHQPELVGEDYDRALSLARRIGYETVSVLDGRRRRQEPLG